MLTTALVRLKPQGNPHPPLSAIRALLRTARRVRSMAGFRRWQSFRALDATNALLFVIEWDSDSAARSAIMDPEVCSLWAMAARWGFQMDPVEILSGAFDRELTRLPAAATLLRLTEQARAPRQSATRESEFALHALAAPGSIRVKGARSVEGRTSLCRIDFDGEDGIWHFQESPICRAWTRETRAAREDETWALNLPRLEWKRASSSLPAWPRPMRQNRTLNVRVSSGTDGAVVKLRLQGHLDAHSSARCERLCSTAVRGGCRRLEMDLSGVESLSREALSLLTRTAREVKQQGGQFVLIDRADRVKQVTRSRHLQASLV